MIVGLGNPGPRYRNTRHNVGYLAVDRVLSRHTAERSYAKFEAEVYQLRVGLDQWLLVKPHTFMNLSGKTVSGIVNYYDDLDLDHLLIVCDDFHLPLGRLRFRRNGSHGGQNGLRDIIAQLGSSEFARLRIGIGAPGGEAIGHVLGTFAPDEVDAVNTAIGTAADGIETWARDGIEAAMNAFNAGGQESAAP